MSDFKNGDTASWDAAQVRRSQQAGTGGQHRPPQKHRRKRRHINPFLYLLCVLVVSALLAGTGWLLASDLCAFSRDIPSTTKISVEVTAEDDIGSIAEKLQNAGLIKYKWFFRLFASVTGAEEEIGIGTYTLNTDMDYHALIAGMHSRSGNLSAETVTVTIPEGYTVRQTIALLAEKGVNTEEALTEAAQTGDFDYDFIDSDSEDITRLEGYLFPDTYEFYVGHNPEDALDRLLRNFVSRMDEDRMAQVEASGRSLQSSTTAWRAPATARAPTACCRSTRRCSMPCRTTRAPSPARTCRWTPPTTCTSTRGCPPRPSPTRALRPSMRP